MFQKSEVEHMVEHVVDPMVPMVDHVVNLMVEL